MGQKQVEPADPCADKLPEVDQHTKNVANRDPVLT
jgi:hypothetical protein